MRRHNPPPPPPQLPSSMRKAPVRDRCPRFHDLRESLPLRHLPGRFFEECWWRKLALTRGHSPSSRRRGSEMTPNDWEEDDFHRHHQCHPQGPNAKTTIRKVEDWRDAVAAAVAAAEERASTKKLRSDWSWTSVSESGRRSWECGRRCSESRRPVGSAIASRTIFEERTNTNRELDDKRLPGEVVLRHPRKPRTISS